MSNSNRHPMADLAAQIEKTWADQGKMVEGAFHAYLVLSNHTAQPEQIKKVMRGIWMLSAQHLFATLIGRLTPGTEPQIEDMQLFEAVTRELHDFEVEIGRIRPQLKQHPLNDENGVRHTAGCARWFTPAGEVARRPCDCDALAGGDDKSQKH